MELAERPRSGGWRQAEVTRRVFLSERSLSNRSMNKKEVPYDELVRHFKTPGNWIPGEQAYFDHFKRIPRKMKKRAKKMTANMEWLSLGQRLWYVQGLDNPNLNRFLIKMVVEPSSHGG